MNRLPDDVSLKHDYADKSWLNPQQPDAFQILDASDCAIWFIVVFVIANVLALCGVI